MNQDQVLSFVRWGLGMGAGFLVGRGVITEQQVTMIGGALGSLIPLAWSFFSHTDKAKMAAPGTITGVSKVEISGTPEVKALADSIATGAKVQAKP